MKTLFAFAGVLALLAPVEAGDRREKKGAGSVPVRGTAENGPDVKKDVTLLTTKIQWQSSLERAKELARKDGKLVFWMQMLGELSGST